MATTIGMGLNALDVSAMKALYWSAVVNGVVAVPVIAAMMMMTNDARVMGQFKVGGWLRILGWLTAGSMALAVAVMAAGWFS